MGLYWLLCLSYSLHSLLSSSLLYSSFWLLIPHTPLLTPTPFWSLPSPTCFSLTPLPLYSSLFPRVCVRAVSVQWTVFWSRHSEILRRPRPCFAILSVLVRSVLPLKKGDTAVMHMSPPSNVFRCMVASSLVPRLLHSGRFLIKHSCMNYSSLVPRPRSLGMRLELQEIYFWPWRYCS